MNTEKFNEQPGHAHYTACSGRMFEIDRFSRRCCGFTLIACGLMFITTWMTFRYGIVSIIPNLIGDRSSLGANAFQSLLIILIAGAGVLGALKYRFMTVLLFILYASMLVSTCISTAAHEIFTVPVALAGVFFTYKAPFMYRDYRILRETEGFPYFNERLAYQEENREYKATYENEYHNVRTAEMAEPSPDYTNNTSSASQKVEMDEL